MAAINQKHDFEDPLNNLGIRVNNSAPPPRKKATFQRYHLKSIVESIIYDRDKLAKDQHRTCWCHRGIRTDSHVATVWRSVDGSNARLSGLRTCASVWACPICAARIANVRRRELERGVLAWHNRPDAPENRVYLLTLTFPHTKHHKLTDLLAKQANAFKIYKYSKPYRRIMAKENRAGSIRSLEVTLGDHGWHPHTHDLIFGKSTMFPGMQDLDGKILHPDVDRLKLAWYRALLKVKLCEPNQLAHVLKHGLDVRGGDYAAEYIAKFGREQEWGMSSEMTLHVAKTGSDQKGAHPFQLLTAYERGNEHAADQFRDYVTAFEGKRMLSWSPGLKKELLAEEETSEEQAALEPLPEERCIGHITTLQLSILIARQQLNLFLLYVAECCDATEGGQQDIDSWFDQFQLRPRKRQGTISTKFMRGHLYIDHERWRPEQAEELSEASP